MPSAVERLELHLSYTCAQSCAFCSESGRMARYRRHPVSLREAVSALARKRREGCRHVTLTGGEPTLHEDLPEVLAAAKKLGYTTYITSNGTRLEDKAYAGLVLPLLDELCLSVHGDRAAVHDRVTRTPGSFRKVLRALRNVECSRRAPFLLSNTVVTSGNIGALVPTLSLLLRHRRVRHCLFSGLAPEGRGGRGFKELAVPLRELAAKVPALVRRVGRRRVALRFFGVPPCVLGRHWRLANDLHWSPRVTVERGRVGGRVAMRSITSLRPDRMRGKTARCRPCALKDGCGGVFRPYLALFGDSELSPFRA